MVKHDVHHWTDYLVLFQDSVEGKWALDVCESNVGHLYGNAKDDIKTLQKLLAELKRGSTIGYEDEISSVQSELTLYESLMRRAEEQYPYLWKGVTR